MEDLPTEISVLTLNCWGLKYVSKLRRERLSEIGRQLAAAEPRPSVVALQECWVHADYESIRRATSHMLPYGKFYFSGPLGGGLAVLSRWPIEESSMVRYPLNGRPTAFWRGDWYVGKGVACARIRYGPGPKHVMQVLNTHTHAPYESGPNDSYLCHRLAQAWEMAKLMCAAAERGHLVLAMGDFNMVPSSLAYRLLTARAPMVRDAWRVVHPDSALGPADDDPDLQRPVPSADFNLRENGAASDGPFCTWRWPSAQQRRLLSGQPVAAVDPETPDPHGKRLDYVFVGAGADAAGGGWVVRRVAVGMTMPHPKWKVSLSDHFAVEATLVFDPSRTLEDAPSDTAIDHDAMLADVLAEVRRYRAREESQLRWRSRHFFAWVAVAMGCFVAVCFSPHNGVAFALSIVSSLGLTGGTIDGLLSLLFFRSELRALREFEWEVQNARAAAASMQELQ